MFQHLKALPGLAVALAAGLATASVMAGQPPAHSSPDDMLHGGAHPMAGGSADGSYIEQYRARLDSLGLTAEQRAALQAIGERYRPRFWELKQRAAGLRRNLSTVTPDDPQYPERVQQAMEGGATIAADAVKLAADMWTELYAELNEQQRQQLRTRLLEEQQRWDEWRTRHKSSQDR